jgi:hypothetical protein
VSDDLPCDGSIFVSYRRAEDLQLGTGDHALHKAAAYRRHARECHTLSRHAQNEDQRLQLLAMAETWESLATQREGALSRH